MDVLLANPRGVCAGVERAISIVERALALYGAPIYVRHEVVHNKFVVDDLRRKGAVFVEELDQVPAGSTLIFSAHGVSQELRREVEDPARLAYVTQTTLSVDDAAAIVAALKVRFPAIVGPKKDDICYATQN